MGSQFGLHPHAGILLHRMLKIVEKSLAKCQRLDTEILDIGSYSSSQKLLASSIIHELNAHFKKYANKCL
jgi:hypothetical protein